MTEPRMIDVGAWTGDWNTLSVPGDAATVRQSLMGCGVGQIHMASLRTVWGHNLHLGNEDAYAAADRFEEIQPVPLLDPTLATWPEELARAADREDVDIIRWLPSYSGFKLTDPCALACAAAVQEAGRVLSIQMRIEDERRQHALARVPDVPLADIIAFAHRHPSLRVIIGGAGWSPILAAAKDILAGEWIYAETSQMDGVDSMRLIVEAGLGARLLFATHAPLFMPLAGLARIIIDLESEPVEAILAGNARRMLES
ncbi:MAG: amidohydrolase family protein [Gemmatimonadetes bacterium]|jgi:uncharacterized protein|nr:amidohydrolase family protein [Gemmatimonadota bacterium]MBT6144741.1 amidohydrolase family protein [Gemmatimonadota bacterium]MBT7861690.1 amidohydrolase family protein [Gemmatimonadota bacterium]